MGRAAANRACPDYPNECVHPWAHARADAEIKATQTEDAEISDAVVDAYNRAYSAVWAASAPTTQGEATAVDRTAVRAGLSAALAAEGADALADRLAAALTDAAGLGENRQVPHETRVIRWWALLAEHAEHRRR